jgi:hypothetical protein
VASPVIWLTGNPVLAYNVVFLAAMPLNAVAAYALARELLSSANLDARGMHAAALVASLAYTFAPYQQVHLSHRQHMTSFGMPLALLWLHGPLPLPPFRPYRLFTGAALALTASTLLTGPFRRAWAERHLVIGLAALVVVLWLMILGPEPEWSTPWRALISGPYRLLVELPGATSIRVPARAWFPAVLCVAMLAGFGAAELLRARRAAPALALVAAIVAEGAFFDGTREAPRPMPRGAIPEGATVLDLPWDEGYQNAVPQFRAVLGGYRTLNGHSGYQPSHVYPLRRAIADLVPGALDAYRLRADLHVIVRPDLEVPVARWIAARAGAEHVFTLEDGARVYRLPQFPRALDAGRSDLLR